MWKAEIKDLLTAVKTLTVICVFLSGVILAFGGHIPPWVTPAEAEAVSETLSKVQQQQTEALKGVTETLGKLTRRLDNTDCDRANEQLARALETLRKEPENRVAIDLQTASLHAIRSIDGCMPDVPPSLQYSGAPQPR